MSNIVIVIFFFSFHLTANILQKSVFFKKLLYCENIFAEFILLINTIYNIFLITNSKFDNLLHIIYLFIFTYSGSTEGYLKIYIF